MKSILISIQPKWCAKIASGKKTIEVRKTCPKIDTPFKCYIYCTENKDRYFLQYHAGKLEEIASKIYSKKEYAEILGKKVLNGKVIGEFVCDCVVDMGKQYAYARKDKAFYEILRSSCLNEEDLQKYAPKGKAFAWHIFDLKIYDEPKELNEFWAYNEEWHKCYENGEDYCCYNATNEYGELLSECAEENVGVNNCYRCWEEWSGWCHRVTRPPQSWCYVEEVKR